MRALDDVVRDLRYAAWMDVRQPGQLLLLSNSSGGSVQYSVPARRAARVAPMVARRFE